MVGIKTKKGKSGNVAQYLTRNQALKKLQLKLSDFRRLCILKGIHPREPKKKFKGANKTYYHVKDIAFLLHEPLLDKFRDIRAYEKKIRRAKARREEELAKKLAQRRPGYKLDHLVRERYPTFVDALRDLDDCLTMVHLFAVMPADKATGIPAKLVEKSRRLALEFQAYIARTHSLRKTFVAVKGIYLQAEVMGQALTWIVPHQLSQVLPGDVDFKVMITFLEFHTTLLQFINYKLYHDLGVEYPPVLDAKMEKVAAGLEALMRDLAGVAAPAPLLESGAAAAQEAAGAEGAEAREVVARRLADLQRKLRGKEVEKAAVQAAEASEDEEEGSEEELEVDSGSEEEEEEEEEGEEGGDDEEEEEEERGAAPEAAGGADEERRRAAQLAGGSAGADADDESAVCGSLFKGMVFFLSREVPREVLSLVVRAFGGEVGFEGEGSKFQEGDDAITHQVVDRPSQAHRFLSRTYIQPQWVLDCANFRVILPSEPYAPGRVPPPHLSPFVEDDKEGYTPDYAELIKELQDAAKAARARGISGTEGGFVAEEGGALAPVPKVAEADAEEAERRYQLELQAELKGETLQEEDGEEEEAAASGSGSEEEEAAAPAAKPAAGKRKAAAPAKAKSAPAVDEEVDEDRMKTATMTRKNRKLYEVVKKAQKRKADHVEKLEKRKEKLGEAPQEGRAERAAKRQR